MILRKRLSIDTFKLQKISFNSNKGGNWHDIACTPQITKVKRKKE